MDGICHYNGAPSTLTCYYDAKPAPDVPDADLRLMVVSTTPTNSATNVPRDTVITINFDHPLDPSTVTNAAIEVDHLGAPITGTPVLDSSGTEIQFTPSQPLPSNAQISVNLNSLIANTGGGRLMPYSFGFTTIDDEPPTLAGSTPADMDVNVAVTAPIDVLFSEFVTGVTTTTFHISQGATDLPGTVTSLGGNAWRFVPAANLPAASVITVHLDAGITDQATNALVPVQFTFTTQ